MFYGIPLPVAGFVQQCDGSVIQNLQVSRKNVIGVLIDHCDLISFLDRLISIIHFIKTLQV